MENFNVDSLYSTSYKDIGNFLYKNLINIIELNREIIFLCIGTDRCTGDSLGPLVGYKLKNSCLNLSNYKIYIYGSLETPVHSKNIIEITNKIYSTFNNPYIIAIDSCLGKISSIGHIFINNNPLYPGLALNKNLPPIGDLSITGIVNISGKYEFLVLQNTRLFTVMNLADCITNGILLFLDILKNNLLLKNNKISNNTLSN